MLGEQGLAAGDAAATMQQDDGWIGCGVARRFARNRREAGVRPRQIADESHWFPTREVGKLDQHASRSRAAADARGEDEDKKEPPPGGCDYCSSPQ